jgi:hypothetical protein
MDELIQEKSSFKRHKNKRELERFTGSFPYPVLDTKRQDGLY